jgi:hypothetical protein
VRGCQAGTILLSCMQNRTKCIPLVSVVTVALDPPMEPVLRKQLIVNQPFTFLSIFLQCRNKRIK